ncbi:ABC transporter ATP-binding protein/permease [Agromyces mediolanus]|uniref:ABC transporter ATP-binding protein n=1 Tax=Agromyces mediolanus TaxID=41986 RepID=UPI00203C5ADB|nr:ABC transporter ATP-binding protein [Agromyces mediolanus]MCM3658252.1 ABC transporter ATP-binding protein/permease [Agromyces mediolanus]
MLPIADGARVRAEVASLIRGHRIVLSVVVALQALAAVAGLLSPWLIGRAIDALTNGTSTSTGIGLVLVALVCATTVQALVTRFAQLHALRLGETIFARLRERFLRAVLGLPLAVVEAAGTGDMLARTTTDIDAVAQMVRFGIPRILVTTTTAALTIGAAFLVSPMLAIATLAGVPILFAGTRWYIRRSIPAYQRQLASYGRLIGVVNETVEGADTIDALALATAQQAKIDAALTERRNAEWYTLGLRSIWFPSTTLGLLVPVIVVLLVGGAALDSGIATAGQVAAITLYTMQLSGPVEELIGWMDRIQVGAAALSRIVGVEDVDAEIRSSHPDPLDERVVAESVRFRYPEGGEVLHGIDLVPAVGERIAVVGPSGSGKSTLGRLLTGIAAPTSGQVTLGGAEMAQIPLDELRGRVALVTQEHHVFVGTLAENLRLAAPAASAQELTAALEVVGADRWALSMPNGLETHVGATGVLLTPAQAQQVALARLVLLDPHTLVLDEATSLIDPRAARGLEQSLDSVLEGRTVIAIAHRLHTARDADRIVVMRGGVIVENGAHDELLAADGEYAALWAAWSSQDSHPA